MSNFVPYFFHWRFIICIFITFGRTKATNPIEYQEKCFSRKHSNRIFNKKRRRKKEKNRKRNYIRWFTTEWRDYCVLILLYLNSKKLSQACETTLNSTFRPHYEWFKWNKTNFYANRHETECRMQNKQKIKDHYEYVIKI